ncbi:hypothetical protein [Arenimonas oryziterrae]|nr:hypothetical protein [Arenimonas oryziterrae]
MNRHYEQSRSLADSLLIAGRYLFAILAALLFLMASWLLVKLVGEPRHSVLFVLFVFVLPLVLLGLVCFAAQSLAKRRSSWFYWIAAGAVALATIFGLVVISLFKGFTPG